MAVRNLFPTKDPQALESEVVFLMRHGGYGSRQEIMSMERAYLNNTIRAVQDQLEQEAEAKQEAMSNDDSGGLINGL